MANATGGIIDEVSTVSWEPPAAGTFTRSFRFGEWISEPVTPLFESWLLTRMEDRLHDTLERWVGQRARQPRHVVVNGWYFYSLDWLGGAAMARNAPRIVARLLRTPRRVAALMPLTVRYSIPLFEREWRDEVQPRYRAAVAMANDQVDALPAHALPGLVDHLADEAGDYFASLAALGGAAYKLEMNLAHLWRRHLRDHVGGSHLPLLTGLEAPSAPPPHAVYSLDWWFPTLGTPAPMPSTGMHARLVREREATEAVAVEVLGGSPRHMRSFRLLLAEAQRLAVVHEEQVREWTLAWPVMRRAVERIGAAAVAVGAIRDVDDVYFLTRHEAISALSAGASPLDGDVDARRATRARQAGLSPPLVIGPMSRGLRWMWESYPTAVGAAWSDAALVSGTPVSPGRTTGPVRVVRGPAQFAELLAGEVLVAPLTAPAWTTLFDRAAAVVTDVGSAASHASIVAREYGIPAVVGCGDATTRLRTGMLVTVDGSTGNVEPGLVGEPGFEPGTSRI